MGSRPGDFSFVASLPLLKRLSIDGFAYEEKAVDYQEIAALPRLEAPGIRVVRPTDLAVLATNGSLRRLSVQGEWFDDTQNFALLTQLEHISFQATNLRDISFVASMPRLKSFISYWNQNVADLSAFSALKDVEELRIFSNSITDVTLLSHLLKLKVLHLPKVNDEAGRVGIRDIEALRGLNAMQSLHLYGNLIEDISALSGMTGLQELNPHTNRIKDLEPLRNLLALKDLHLGSNLFESLEPWRDHSRIEYFVGWESPLAEKKVLPTATNCPMDAASSAIAGFCANLRR